MVQMRDSEIILGIHEKTAFIQIQDSFSLLKFLKIIDLLKYIELIRRRKCIKSTCKVL